MNRNTAALRGLVRARAPLRLGLAGGGTDVSPYSDLYNGAVLNATIDKYAYAIIEIRDDDKVQYTAADLGVTEIHDIATLNASSRLALHQGVYRRIMQDFNDGNNIPLTLTTLCDVPAGSGLGSSSTLVVAMLKAFVELLNLPLGEYEIAHLAYEIERIDLGLNGGKQDQYAATFGGFNFIEFGAQDKVIVNPLRIKNWIISELESSLLLYYTGASRESAEIIDRQVKNVKSGNTKSIEAMHNLKAEAVHMKECILKGDIHEFGKSMVRSWEAKKGMATSISNTSIEKMYATVMQAGAYAGKISGAGGGGFMMLLVDPTKRAFVLNSMGEYPGYFIPCHFVKHGTEGWKI
ncbi:MAG: dehydrogenase [Ktedonobacteraceae bacterium]